MEETNPWLDPDSCKHKNKKSVKPKPKEFLKPGFKKTENKEVLDFLETLVEDGLKLDMPKKTKEWVSENFDDKWLEDFVDEIKILKDEILSSHYYPDLQKMLLLKYIFLLQQGI